MQQRLALLLSFAVLTACSAVGGSPEVDAVADTDDAGTDTTELDIVDDGSGDTAEDTDDDADGSGDVSEGGFGVPCDRDEECASGYCVENVDGGRVCTQFCVDDCPDEDFECRLIGNTGGDLVRICFPKYDDLCRECDFDRQCGGLSDRCLEMLDGKFCGRDCSTDELCPDGYECEETTKQCIPELRLCASCLDPDGDLHGDGFGCLGADCDQDDRGRYDGAPELCDYIDNDCDNEIDEDFDITSDPEHCGECNDPCELDHAVPGCSSSTCFILECEDLYYDLNGDPEDGCEYFCEFEDFDVEDRPDHLYRDTNCDGIDGDPAHAIFVAPDGDDDNAGTPDSPLQSIGLASDMVADDPFIDSVYIAEGQYYGPSDGEGGFLPFEIRAGVNLFGGYDAETWRRAPGNQTRMVGSTPAVVARDVHEATELGGIHIEGLGGRTLDAGNGETSIGFMVVDSTDIVLTGCNVRSGVGGQGRAGDPGRAGNAGTGGGTGNAGSPDSGVTCDNVSAPARGNGGASACGNPGGIGGSAGHGEGNGSAGARGSGTGAGSGGPAGSGGDDDFFGCPDGNGTSAGNGTAGADGARGDGGTAGAAAGTFDGDIWVAGPGGTGGTGSSGAGGGGGGGGGGATGNGECGNFGCCDGWGGAGGGGGGGGCGGTGGAGGFGGGSSFAVYAIDSSLTVQYSTLTAANGGAGGNGGGGGNGGQGGDPGPGGAKSCNGGNGGYGGRGGNGGQGGAGGGGAGGSSVALVTIRAGDVVIDDTALVFSNAGAGGTGGTAGDDGRRRDRIDLR